MTEKLLGAYKNRLGEVALVPASGGAFEVSVGEERVYSKLETGRFPDERSLIQDIGGKI